MAVPWTQLLRWAPQILTLSRELMHRSRNLPQTATPPAGVPEDRWDLHERLAALEKNERSQAELVERMAEQQADMAKALVALHKRQNPLIATVVVLAIAVAGLVIWQFFG
jgi:hypothetical protein